MALTIADNGYMGLDSVSFLNFDERWRDHEKPHAPLSDGKDGPAGELRGWARARLPRPAMRWRSTMRTARASCPFTWRASADKDAIEGIITLTDEPVESIVIATPFDKPGHFYYNQKINCLRASGWVELGGERFELTPDRFFAVLDWGAACWTYHNTWYWSSASGELDGVPFGWNLGYGFGDTAAATENALVL